MTVTRFQQKRGTSAQWAARVTPLLDGELGIDKDTGIIKVGDGFTLWANLPAAFESQYLPLLGKAKDSYRLDGLQSTDFLRSDGKAVDSDKLDGIDSTGFLKTADAASFLPVAGKAADADKLDGVDSASFAKLTDLAAFGRDRGTGNVWPTTDLRRGDIYYHTDVSALGVYSGIRWTLVRSGTVATLAARDSITWSYPGMQLLVTADGRTYEYQNGGIGWTLPWYSSWGALADLEFSGNGVALSTSFATMAVLSPKAMVGNRRIRATANAMYYTASGTMGTIRFRISLYKNSVADDGGDIDFRIGGSVADLRDFRISRTLYTSGPASTTYGLTAWGIYVNGLGSSVYRVWTADQCRFYVEDLGPTSAPPAS